MSLPGAADAAAGRGTPAAGEESGQHQRQHHDGLLAQGTVCEPGRGNGFPHLHAIELDPVLLEGLAQLAQPRLQHIAGRLGLLVPHLDTGQDPNEIDLRAVYDAGSAPGLDASPRFLTAAVAAVVDARDQPSDPHHGFFLGAACWRFQSRQAGAFTFTRLAGDVRWYLTVPTSQGVLAVRALLSTDLLGPGAQVPFYLMQTLGGGETLRGFSESRFRDRTVTAFSAEYRWRVMKYFDAGPFVDVGTVAPSVSDLRASALEVSGGVRFGLRYKDRVIAHIDWGRCHEGQRVMIGASTLF
jgi:hypothetical protein